MKTSLLLVFVLLATTSFEQFRTPAASPTANIHQDFGLASIDISYSRPGMKGRKIFGDLVPFGKVWRTGANGPTIITFGDEVIIGGTKIPAGKYGLVTIPGVSEWTIIITKQLDINNPALYKAENDVVQVKVPVHKLPLPVETFSIAIDDVKQNSCAISLWWEKTMVALPVTTDIDTRIMEEIDTAIIGKNPPYYAAASYYFNNGKDLHKAEEWAVKATEQAPDAYYMFYLLAQIEEKLGNKQGAVTAANKSIELAKKVPNADFVALNEKLLARLK
ncbi:MAG TPA: DUF2911 domain-containing protein [Chitinophagaceae bacterium]|jgi:hypothetical protein|nr:DUF2911 domain-containing protein [Chitinophagaceae bacterium]